MNQFEAAIDHFKPGFSDRSVGLKWYADRSSLLGIAFGCADSGVAFTYNFGLDVSIYYFATLVCKIILLMIIRPAPQRNTIYDYIFLSLILWGVFVGSMQHDVATVVVLSVVGFIAHLFLTGTFLNVRAVRFYCCAIMLMTCAIIGYFILSWGLGGIRMLYGRALFFGGTQPNLGGEIIVAGLFVSGLYLTQARWLALFALSLIPLFLLQARAALLTAMCMGAISIYYYVFLRRSLFVKLTVVLSIICVFLAFSGAIQHWLESAFLLTDQYRGLGSGFTGRDVLWGDALDAFYRSPLIGQGTGYFDSIGSIGAHNLLLFILAEDGFVGLLIFLWIFAGVFRFGFSRETLWLLPFFVLAAFNDRFINLNPYPFLFYVFMWIPKQYVHVSCLTVDLQKSSLTTDG